MQSGKLKSVWSVLAGVLFTIVVTTLVDIALHLLSIYPPKGQPLTDAMAALATAYRIPISIAGAWLTARLAPNRPMRHALTLGGVGSLLGVVGVVVTWGKGMGPPWYPIALAALALPQCWLGGKLFLARSHNMAGQ
jgi:hypothetical protein